MFFFLTELNQIFEEGFRHTFFKVPEKVPAEFKPPGVHIGAIPSVGNSTEEKEDWPFIVNRIVDGEDKIDGARFTVNTTCGVWNGDTVEAGENEILNMINRCRALILQNETIAKKYRLEHPIKWHMGSVSDPYIQAFPFFSGVIASKWEGPTYEHNLTTKEQKEIYGYL